MSRRRSPALRAASRWRREYLEAHEACEVFLTDALHGNVLSPSEQLVVRRWVLLRPCGYYSVDVHEIVKRGRGGSTTDENNVLAVCRNCHDFTEASPEIAQKLGLLASNPKWRTR